MNHMRGLFDTLGIISLVVVTAWFVRWLGSVLVTRIRCLRDRTNDDGT